MKKKNLGIKKKSPGLIVNTLPASDQKKTTNLVGLVHKYSVAKLKFLYIILIYNTYFSSIEKFGLRVVSFQQTK